MTNMQAKENLKETTNKEGKKIPKSILTRTNFANEEDDIINRIIEYEYRKMFRKLRRKQKHIVPKYVDFALLKCYQPEREFLYDVNDAVNKRILCKRMLNKRIWRLHKIVKNSIMEVWISHFGQ